MSIRFLMDSEERLVLDRDAEDVRLQPLQRTDVLFIDRKSRFPHVAARPHRELAISLRRPSHVRRDAKTAGARTDVLSLPVRDARAGERIHRRRDLRIRTLYDEIAVSESGDKKRMHLVL